MFQKSIGLIVTFLTFSSLVYGAIINREVKEELINLNQEIQNEENGSLIWQIKSELLKKKIEELVASLKKRGFNSNHIERIVTDLLIELNGSIVHQRNQEKSKILQDEEKLLPFKWIVSDVFEQHKMWIDYALFTPDSSKVITAGRDGSIFLWPVNNPSNWSHLNIHRGTITNLELTVDGKYLLSTGRDAKVVLWELTPPYNKKILKPPRGKYVKNAYISKDDSRVIGLTDERENLYFWNFPNGDLIKTLSFDEEIVNLDSNVSGLLAVGFRSGKVSIFNIKDFSKSEIHKIDIDSPIDLIQFSPNGKLLAIGGYKDKFSLYDIDNMSLTDACWQNKRYRDIEFSPHSDQFALAMGDNSVCVWDFSKNKLDFKFEHEERSWISSVKYSPDGSMILTGASDNTAALVYSDTGSKLQFMNFHSGWVRNATFSPNGKYIVTVSVDKKVAIWERIKIKSLF